MSMEQRGTKERLIKGVALSDEELPQVAGGGSEPVKVTCPNCGKPITLKRGLFVGGMA